MFVIPPQVSQLFTIFSHQPLKNYHLLVIPLRGCLLTGIILPWGFLIWELIFIYCGLFVLILVGFFFFCVLFLLSLSFGQISPLAFFLSAVAVNHLKKVRGEIWPKRSEKRNNTKKKQQTTKMRTKSPQ